MVQGALSAAGVRREGYGLEVGRSVRTAGGAGAYVSPRAELVVVGLRIYYCVLGSTMVFNHYHTTKS